MLLQKTQKSTIFATSLAIPRLSAAREYEGFSNLLSMLFDDVNIRQTRLNANLDKKRLKVRTFNVKIF